MESNLPLSIYLYNSGAPPARRPLGELNRNSAITGEGKAIISSYFSFNFFHQIFISLVGVKARPVASSGGVPNGPSPKHLLRDLQDQLTTLFAAKPSEKALINMGTTINIKVPILVLSNHTFNAQTTQKIHPLSRLFGSTSGRITLTNMDSVMS